MKTVAQVIEKYRNRQNPEYKSIKLSTNDGDIQAYHRVSNIETTHDEQGIWLEFDCVVMHAENDPTHVKLHGHVTEYVNSIVE